VMMRAERGVKGAARPREALRKMGRSQPLRLVVDRRVHAEELIRFEADVVRGPGADDCAIWVAAVGADGYGSLPSQGHGPIGTWANQIGWYRPWRRRRIIRRRRSSRKTPP
jgi:hypothetical protein